MTLYLATYWPFKMRFGIKKVSKRNNKIEWINSASPSFVVLGVLPHRRCLNTLSCYLSGPKLKQSTSEQINLFSEYDFVEGCNDNCKVIKTRLPLFCESKAT